MGMEDGATGPCVGAGLCALVFPQLFKGYIFVPCKQNSPYQLIELAE